MAEAALNRKSFRRFQDFLRTREALTGRRVRPTELQAFLEAELSAEQGRLGQVRQMDIQEKAQTRSLDIQERSQAEQERAQREQERLQQEQNVLAGERFRSEEDRFREQAKGQKKAARVSGITQLGGTATQGYKLYKDAPTSYTGTGQAMPTPEQYRAAQTAQDANYGFDGERGSWESKGGDKGAQAEAGTEAGTEAGGTEAQAGSGAGTAESGALSAQYVSALGSGGTTLSSGAAPVSYALEGTGVGVGASAMGAQGTTAGAASSTGSYSLVGTGVEEGASYSASSAGSGAAASSSGGGAAAGSSTSSGAATGTSSTYSAAAPYVAGAVQIYFGYENLKEGHERTGSAQVGAGIGTMIAPGIGTVVGAGVGYVVGTVMDLTGTESSDHSIICSELRRQGLLDKEVCDLDGQHRIQFIDDATYRGYVSWAKYVVKAMQKSRLITRVVAPIGRAWAYEMAHRLRPDIPGSLFGKGLMLVGVPICRFLGRRIK